MKALLFTLLSLLLLALAFYVEAADNNLLLYLSFDAEGKVVKDETGNTKGGTIFGGVEWVEGKSGKALLFDSKSHVEVPHDKNLDLPEAHTISYWIKWDGAGSSWSPFVAKRQAGGANYQSWVGSDKIFDYYNGVAVVSADTPITLGEEWVFLTTTHDGKNTVSFYIDGSFDSSKDEAIGKSNNFALLVGQDGVGNFGAGVIDEVALFDRELTEAEIKQLMEEGVKAFAAVAYSGKIAATWSTIKKQ